MQNDNDIMKPSRKDIERDVRILLVGEPGVGKSSLIYSLISEEFDPNMIPRKLGDITIPPDVTPEKIPTLLIDYSAFEQDEDSLVEEIKKADVICIVFSLDIEGSAQKIEHYWIPKIKEVEDPLSERKKPILLIGNKSDINDRTLEAIIHIMNDHAEIETCVECSAKSLKNVSEVFYYAQKAVLHPTSPLYAADTKQLTPKCKEALTRIFKIIDQDNDNLLNDQELQRFQRKCFKMPLQSQAVEDVKNVVRKHIVDGIHHDNLTLAGFLFIQRLFIQKGRHETTWTVLRSFGYDDTLKLSSSYLSDNLEVPDGSSVEFTHCGFIYLIDLFTKYDKDGDNCISREEMKELFSTCPVEPWSEEVFNSIHTSPKNWITRDGFIAQWVLQTNICPERTSEMLVQLGYLYQHDELRSALQVTRSRKIDLKLKHTSRTTFHCNVIGAKGSGKTVFLQGLIGNDMESVKKLDRRHLSKYTCNGVQIYGHDNFLILHEVDINKQLMSSDFNCDAVVLIYDINDYSSFEQCATTYLKYLKGKEFVPTILVACHMTKGMPPAHRDGPSPVDKISPAQFANAHNLLQPFVYNAHDQDTSEIYYKLTSFASFPHLAIKSDSKAMSIGKISLGLLAVGGIGFAIYKYNKSK